MKKEKIITVAVCVLLVFLMGLFYLRSGSSGVIKDSAEVQDKEEFIKNDSAESIWEKRGMTTAETLQPDSSSVSAAGQRGQSDEAAQEALREAEERPLQDNEDNDRTQAKKPEAQEKVYKNSMIRVYICGAVKHAGVYELSADSRICDAVEAAGGMKKSASLTYVNQAQFLKDGQQVTIPTRKQAAMLRKRAAKKKHKKEKDKNNTNTVSVSGSKNEKDTVYHEKGDCININTATKEELMTLSGIGESKASSILEYRESNRFQCIEDIKNVPGIKDGVFQNIKDKITV